MAVMSKAVTFVVAGAGASIAAFFSETFRETVTSWSGLDAPGGGWRILAVVFALANLKMMPFMWHVSLPYAESET
jgi:hypothetical protein